MKILRLVSGPLSTAIGIAQRIATMKTEEMNKQLPSRREFNGLCAALTSSLPAASATIAALSSHRLSLRPPAQPQTVPAPRN